MADAEWLVAALRRGEPEAVEALVTQYSGRIYRLEMGLLRDQRDAEEVTQDVLLTVVEKIHTFRGEAAFSSWLYRIALNAGYMRLRSRRARAEASLESLPPAFDDTGRHVKTVQDWSASLDDPATASEARTVLESALRRLPEDYRIVVQLRDFEGLTTEEAAETLGLTVAAVKSRLHRARVCLRQELADFFSPSRASKSSLTSRPHRGSNE